MIFFRGKIPRIAVPFAILSVSVLLACFAFFSTRPVSAVPTTMNFQGRLADATGTIVPDGLYNMQFRLFTVSSGGSSVWNETRETTNRVQVTNGLFSTKLGEVNPISASLFASGNLFFEITLATPGTATCNTASCASWESPMTPRHQMSTSAYAFNSDTLDGLDSTAFAAANGSANYIQNGTSPQTADFNITGTGTAATLQAATFDRASAGALTIGGTNATSIALSDNTTVNANLTVSAGNSLTLVGGNTASRPASPTEGMVYYDTDTKQLLTYANGKWQADRSDAVLVAASNSSNADKSAADYVADGNTGAAADGDQVQINSAITAGSGKKVVLLAGTYTVDATILVPNNTVVTGIGNATVVEFGDIDVTDNLIENSDVATGTGVTIRDMKLDGRNDQNLAGSQTGILMNNMGSATSNRQGLTLTNVEFTRFRGGTLYLQASHNSVISNNRIFSNANDGFSLYSGSSYNKLINNTASDNGGGFAFAVYSDNNTLIGNTARNNVWGYGIEIGGDNNVVTGNTLSGNYSGLQIQGDNLTITGNTVLASILRGVGIIYSTKVVFSDNVIDGSTEEGVELFATSNSTVSSNTVTNSLLHGILVGGASGNVSTGSTIENNVVQNNGGSGANHSIYVETYANDTKVTGNKITDTAGSGNAIRTGATAVNNTYIAGNVFSGTGATTISDLGTASVFAGQAAAAGGLDMLYKQAASSSAFQIQNASGTSFLTANNSTNTLTLQASTNTPTLGSDLFGSAVFDYAASTNWTGSGTGPTATATHAAGSTAGLVLTAGTTFPAVAGTTYEVEFDISGYSAGYVLPYIGGEYSGLQYSANGTNIKAIIRAFNTTSVRFYSDSAFVGTISNVTVKAYTGMTPSLALADSSGATTMQIRTGAVASDSVYMGVFSGQVSTGSANTSLGSGSLADNTSGGYNTAIGQIALSSNVTGSNNTVVGAQGLQRSVSGNDNTAIGMWTLDGVTTGSGNVALGSFAGYGSGNSSNNVYIGLNSGTTDTGTYGAFANAYDLQNATAIGAYAIAHQSNSIILGSINTPTFVGIGTTKPDGLFSVSPTAYSTTGTAVRASQSTTTVTATGGTPFTSAMVGMKLIYGDGTSDTIQSFTSSTQVTVSTSRTVSSQHFRIHRGGFQVASSGDVSVKNTSTAAFQIQNSAGTSAFTVDTTNNNVTLGANTSLTLTGGATANRPASPVDGMVYYDTDTKQLLVYNGTTSKWQADKSDAVLVAASDSSAGDKAAADYLADGNTGAASDGDQVQINSALTAATGKKVVLLAGTYTLDAAISVPNSTILSGVGEGTQLTLPNTFNTAINMITNTDTSTGTAVSIRDLKVEGNKANQTLGTMRGIYFSAMGDNAAPYRQGAKIENVRVNNMRSAGIYFTGSDNNTVARVTTNNTSGSGFTFDYTSHDNTLSNSHSEGNSGAGFNIWGNHNVVTANNAIGNTGAGFDIEGDNISASGNTSQNNTAQGFLIYATTYVSLVGNTARNNTDSGVFLSTGSTDNVVTANTLMDNGGASNNNGIIVSGGSNVNSITNNIIGDSAATTNYAINITSGTSNYLSGNVFSSGTINDAGTTTIYSNQSKTAGGLDTLYKQAASSTAFQIQNASSASLLTADSSSTNNRIQIGSNSTDATAIFFMLDRYNSGTDPTGADGAMYYNTNTSKFRCYQAGWTDCITAAGANASLSNLASVAINQSLIAGTTNTIDLGSSGTTWRAGYFGTSLSSPVIRPAADGTAAFKIQNTAGTTDYLTLDTTNNQILLGTSDTTGVQLVLDTKTDATDPTGANGGMYYNSNLGKFRCYENGTWKDCVNGYSINVQALTSSPADAGITYFGTLPKAPVTAAGTSKIYIRKAGTVRLAEIYVYSGTAGTNEAWSIYVRKNNTTDTLIQTVSAATNERVFTNSSLNISVAAGDYLEIKSAHPLWATNPLTTVYGGYLYID